MESRLGLEIQIWKLLIEMIFIVKEPNETKYGMTEDSNHQINDSFLAIS